MPQLSLIEGTEGGRPATDHSIGHYWLLYKSKCGPETVESICLPVKMLMPAV